MGNVFEGEDRYPGVSGQLRRSLSNAKFDEVPVMRIREAATKAKIKTISPAYEIGSKRSGTPDVWAHVGIPDKRTVVFVVDNQKVLRNQEVREKWKAHGWKCLIITRENACNLPVQRLSAALAEEIGGKK